MFEVLTNKDQQIANLETTSIPKPETTSLSKADPKPTKSGIVTILSGSLVGIIFLCL